MNIRRFAQMALLLSACTVISHAFGDELKPQDIIQKVEETLSTTKTIRIVFEEIFEWKQTGEKQTIQGEMLLNGKNQFRVTAADQIIVSDGITLWTYSKPSNRVLIDRLEKTDNTSLPQQIFFSYKKDYQVKKIQEESVSNVPCYVLLFSGENKDLYFTQIKVWIEKDKWVPKRIEQTDISKNKVIYILSEVQMEASTDAGTFQFVIPEGAEVIKL